MKHFAYISLAMGLALAACSHQDADDSAGNSDVNVAMTNDMAAPGAVTADTAFLGDAIKGDNNEIALGQLAATQGMSQKVKDFGTMLATDHGAHKDKAVALLTGAGGTASADPTDEGKANLAKLMALKGAGFDTAFKAAMIDDHNKDIAKYEKQAAGTDATTAQLAKDTLPPLKKHLEAAKAL